jgi:hypothetical protein
MAGFFVFSGRGIGSASFRGMKSDSIYSRAGLCEDCGFAKIIASNKGGRFYYCRRSETNSAFPKYPHLPMRTCSGFESRVTRQEST